MAEIMIIDNALWTKKVVPLSSPAYLAFDLLTRAEPVIETASVLAKRSPAEEISSMDWLGYLAGIPDVEVPAKIWESRTEDVIDLVNDWLSEEK